MTRATTNDLAAAQGHLEELATRYHSRNNQNGWPDLALLLDLLVWLDGDLEHAKRAAVWPPGTDDTHTIGRHGLGRPVEGRFLYPEVMTATNRGIILNDPLVKELSKLRSEWRSQLGQLVDGFRQRAHDAANWPTRSEAG